MLYNRYSLDAVILLHRQEGIVTNSSLNYFFTHVDLYLDHKAEWARGEQMNFREETL
uniref:Unkown protein n=1 Tax=Riptortus pedestris TaxID=329032 RepID=R4WDZ7_RIPPE|nr:unkown protein [Riptortus pedestris]